MIDAIIQNWQISIGLLTFGTLSYWVFDEREEEKSPSDTILDVGDRADNAFGGVLGVVGAIGVVGMSLATTLGNQFADLLAAILGMFGTSPLVGSNILVAVIGAVMSGPRVLLVGVVMLLIGLAVKRLN